MAKKPAAAPKATAKRKKNTEAAKPPKAEKKSVRKKSDEAEEEKGLDVSRIGRPPKLVESDALIKQLIGLRVIDCTLREGAAALFVSENTLRDFLEANPRCAEAWNTGAELGKLSLRRMQWKSAKAGNHRMQVWLGKQRLGQADKVDHRLAGHNGGPIQTIGGEMTPQQAAQAYADSINGGF